MKKSDIKFKTNKKRFCEKRKIGVKDGFLFSYCFIEEWWVVVSHNKKDIRFNTLWESIEFKNESEVVEWCNNFDYTKFNCLGTLK